MNPATHTFPTFFSFLPHHQNQLYTILHSPLSTLSQRTIHLKSIERRVEKRPRTPSSSTSFTRRSERPLLVFLSVYRKAFEKRSLHPRPSIWTLTPASRSPSASSRRRTGTTPKLQPQKLTSRESSTYQLANSASDGKANTLRTPPIFLLGTSDSARKKSVSAVKRIVTVRAAEKTSTFARREGQ